MATKKVIYGIAGLGTAAVTATAIAVPLSLRDKDSDNPYENLHSGNELSQKHKDAIGNKQIIKDLEAQDKMNGTLEKVISNENDVVLVYEDANHSHRRTIKVDYATGKVLQYGEAELEGTGTDKHIKNDTVTVIDNSDPAAPKVLVRPSTDVDDQATMGRIGTRISDINTATTVAKTEFVQIKEIASKPEDQLATNQSIADGIKTQLEKIAITTHSAVSAVTSAVTLDQAVLDGIKGNDGTMTGSLPTLAAGTAVTYTVAAKALPSDATPTTVDIAFTVTTDDASATDHGTPATATGNITVTLVNKVATANAEIDQAVSNAAAPTIKAGSESKTASALSPSDFIAPASSGTLTFAVTGAAKSSTTTDGTTATVTISVTSSVSGAKTGTTYNVEVPGFTSEGALSDADISAAKTAIEQVVADGTTVKSTNKAGADISASLQGDQDDLHSALGISNDISRVDIHGTTVAWTVGNVQAAPGPGGTGKSATVTITIDKTGGTQQTITFTLQSSDYAAGVADPDQDAVDNQKAKFASFNPTAKANTPEPSVGVKTETEINNLINETLPTLDSGITATYTYAQGGTVSYVFEKNTKQATGSFTISGFISSDQKAVNDAKAAYTAYVANPQPAVANAVRPADKVIDRADLNALLTNNVPADAGAPVTTTFNIASTGTAPSITTTVTVNFVAGSAGSQVSDSVTFTITGLISQDQADVQAINEAQVIAKVKADSSVGNPDPTTDAPDINTLNDIVIANGVTAVFTEVARDRDSGSLSFKYQLKKGGYTGAVSSKVTITGWQTHLSADQIADAIRTEALRVTALSDQAVTGIDTGLASAYTFDPAGSDAVNAALKAAAQAAGGVNPTFAKKATGAVNDAEGKLTFVATWAMPSGATDKTGNTAEIVISGFQTETGAEAAKISATHTLDASAITPPIAANSLTAAQVGVTETSGFTYTYTHAEVTASGDVQVTVEVAKGGHSTQKVVTVTVEKLGKNAADATAVQNAIQNLSEGDLGISASDGKASEFSAADALAKVMAASAIAALSDDQKALIVEGNMTLSNVDNAAGTVTLTISGHGANNKELNLTGFAREVTTSDVQSALDAITLAQVSTGSGAATAIKGDLSGLETSNLEHMTISATLTAAVDGTAASPSGTPGSITVTATPKSGFVLSGGEASLNGATPIPVPATPYTAKDAQVGTSVDAAVGVLSGRTLTYTIGTATGDKAAVESALKGLVTKASGDTSTPTFNGSWGSKDLDVAVAGDYTYTVSATGYNDVVFTVTVAPQPASAPTAGALTSAIQALTSVPATDAALQTAIQGMTQFTGAATATVVRATGTPDSFAIDDKFLITFPAPGSEKFVLTLKTAADAVGAWEVVTDTTDPTVAEKSSPSQMPGVTFTSGGLGTDASPYVFAITENTAGGFTMDVVKNFLEASDTNLKTNHWSLKSGSTFPDSTTVAGPAKVVLEVTDIAGNVKEVHITVEVTAASQPAVSPTAGALTSAIQALTSVPATDAALQTAIQGMTQFTGAATATVTRETGTADSFAIDDKFLITFPAPGSEKFVLTLKTAVDAVGAWEVVADTTVPTVVEKTGTIPPLTGVSYVAGGTGVDAQHPFVFSIVENTAGGFTIDVVKHFLEASDTNLKPNPWSVKSGSTLPDATTVTPPSPITLLVTDIVGNEIEVHITVEVTAASQPPADPTHDALQSAIQAIGAPLINSGAIQAEIRKLTQFTGAASAEVSDDFVDSSTPGIAINNRYTIKYPGATSAADKYFTLTVLGSAGSPAAWTVVDAAKPTAANLLPIVQALSGPEIADIAAIQTSLRGKASIVGSGKIEVAEGTVSSAGSLGDGDTITVTFGTATGSKVFTVTLLTANDASTWTVAAAADKSDEPQNVITEDVELIYS